MHQVTKVLVFNRHYLPGFKAGGPIRSIANMIEALGSRIEFFVVTTDRDLLDVQPYPEVLSDRWVSVGNAKVCYLSPDNRSIKALKKIVLTVAPDKIYLNSFFDPIFSTRLLFARRFRLIPPMPVIVAPRGEFSKGAIELKGLRKKIYLRLFDVMNVYRGLIWHASTAFEADDIARTVSNDCGSIQIAIDLGSAADPSALSKWQERPTGAPLRVCFLSRISPKKNLPGALEALSLTKAPIVFDIFGPKEDIAHWRECERMINLLPPHVEVCYRGVVSHEEAASTIAAYDLFLFPTLGENFGHVIIEALSGGVPVLISDQTPWQDVEEQGVGWIVASGAPADYAHHMDRCFELTPFEQRHLRQRSAAYADRVLKDKVAIDQNLALFCDG